METRFFSIGYDTNVTDGCARDYNSGRPLGAREKTEKQTTGGKCEKRKEKRERKPSNGIMKTVIVLSSARAVFLNLGAAPS